MGEMVKKIEQGSVFHVIFAAQYTFQQKQEKLS